MNSNNLFQINISLCDEGSLEDDSSKCNEFIYFAARASATATLQLYTDGSSIPAQSPLKHLKQGQKKNTTFHTPMIKINAEYFPLPQI